MTSKRPDRMTSFTGRRTYYVFVITIAVVILAAGCGSGRPAVKISQDDINAFLADKPGELHRAYERMLLQGPQNYVLNNMEIGLAAIDLEYYALAEKAFDNALKGIETVYANDPIAKKARGLWHEEGMKDFKGEPYERAMAYYYRGVLYMRRGDYENARACFKSGILQDAFAEDQQYRCDFALLHYMEGWTSRLSGQKANALRAFDEAKKLQKDLVIPAETDNFLILIESGTAPEKIARGRNKSMLSFRQGERGYRTPFNLEIGKRQFKAIPAGDIFFQASTRGGRPMDGILEGQVVFKEFNDDMGEALTNIGLEAIDESLNTNDPNAGLVGLTFVLVGTFQRALAAAVRTEADTRYWRNLPDSISVAAGRLPRGTAAESMSALFYGTAGKRQRELRRKVNIQFSSDGQYALAWIRPKPTLDE